jgi:hypothetical protein
VVDEFLRTYKYYFSKNKRIQNPQFQDFEVMDKILNIIYLILQNQNKYST